MTAERDALLWHRIRLAAEAEARGCWQEAAMQYRSAQELNPEDHRLACNLGNVLWLADLPGEALRYFERAVQLAPLAALPWRGLGNAARDQLHFGRAAFAYRQSSFLCRDSLTDWNLSQILVGLERYREAWALSERRLLVNALQPYRHGHGWLGDRQSLQKARKADVPLQIWTEQGFGDTLQFLRWLEPLGHLLQEFGPRPQLLVEEPLVGLLQRGLTWLPMPPQVIAKGEEKPQPPGWEQHHVSLQSLPARLHDGSLAHPGSVGAGPWLRLGDQLSGRPGQELHVGVLWAAGRKLDDGFVAREYNKRSLGEQELGWLLHGLHAQGAKLVALQHGADRQRVQPWRTLLSSELPEDADFHATARLLLGVDLVVTVDTALAHLAGCLGCRTWVLLPWSADPRWLRQRHDSPWYPNLRLFRQPGSGQWWGAIDQLLQTFRREFNAQG